MRGFLLLKTFSTRIVSPLYLTPAAYKVTCTCVKVAPVSQQLNSKQNQASIATYKIQIGHQSSVIINVHKNSAM